MARSSSTGPRPTGIRRVERWLVGLSMAIVAFVLEKVVMRSVREEGKAPAEPAPTTLTSKGGEVDFDGT